MPCSRTVYEPVLSNAALTSLSIDKILSNEISYFENNYFEAMDTQWRVRKDYFVPLAQKLISTRSTYKKYLDALEQLVGNEALIILVDSIQRSLESLIDIFQHDFKNVYLADIITVKRDIDLIFKPNRDSFYYLLDKVSEKAKLVVLYIGNVVSYDVVYENLRVIINDTYDIVTDAAKTFPRYRYGLYFI